MGQSFYPGVKVDVKAEIVKLRLRGNEHLPIIITDDKSHEVVVNELILSRDETRVAEYAERILTTKKYNVDLRYKFLKAFDFKHLGKIVSHHSDGSPYVYDDRLIGMLYQETEFLGGALGFYQFLGSTLMYDKPIGGDNKELIAYLLNNFMPSEKLHKMIELNILDSETLTHLLKMMDSE